MKQPTFDQAMAFLKAGGKATFDGFRPDQQLFWRDGYILVTKSMFGHVDDKWGAEWCMKDLMQRGVIPALLPMENATKEAALVWMELGGKVKANGCGKCEFRMVDGQVKNLSKSNSFASCCALVGKFNLLESKHTAEQQPEPQPESKPVTRLDVIEHLKKGGKVQWRDGSPGTWIAKHGMLLWAAKDDVFYHISTHDHKGQWFADMTDEEIGHLELVPMAEKKPPISQIIIDELGTNNEKKEATELKPAFTTADIIAHFSNGGMVKVELQNGTIYYLCTAGHVMLKGEDSVATWPSHYQYDLNWCARDLVGEAQQGTPVTLVPIVEPPQPKQEEAELKPEPAPAPEKSPTRAEITAHLEKGGTVEVERWDTYKMVEGKPHFWYTWDKGWLPSFAVHDFEGLVDRIVVLRDERGRAITLLPIEKQEPEKQPEPKKPTAAEIKAHLEKGGEVQRDHEHWRLVEGAVFYADTLDRKNWRRSVYNDAADCAHALSLGPSVTLLPTVTPTSVTPEQARAHLFKGGKVNVTELDGLQRSATYWIEGGQVLAANSKGVEWHAALNNKPLAQWFDKPACQLELL